MRITTKVIQGNSINNINTNKVLQDKLNNQMATEKKIVRPSDDPVVAIRALRLRTNVSQVTQYYEKNAPDAESWMKVTEDSLTTVSSVITDMIEQCTKGASEKLTATDRTTILNELKALRDEVYATGNADYAGRSVFTGYRTETTLKYTEAESRKYSITEQLKNDALDTITYVNSAYLNGINQVNYNSGAYFDPSGTLKKNSDMMETKISESTIHRIRLAYENIDAEDIDFRIYKGDKYDAAASTNALINELNYGRKIYDAAGNPIASGTHGITYTLPVYESPSVPDSATFEALSATTKLLVEKEGCPGEYEDATEFDATKTYYTVKTPATISGYSNRQVGANGDFYTANGTKYASKGDMETALHNGEKIYDAAGNEIDAANGAYTYTGDQQPTYALTSVASENDFTSSGTDWYVLVDGEYKKTNVYDPTIEYYKQTNPGQKGTITFNDSKPSDYYIRTAAEDLPVSERYQTMSFLNVEVISENNIPNPYQKMVEYDQANAEAVKKGQPATDRAILIPETGELLISSSAYEKIMKLKDDVTSPTYDEGQFQIEYKKTTWKKDDLRPEHYFACTDMSDSNPVNHIRYNTDYLSGIVEKQSIEYDVGLNQTIRVNTTADEVFTHAIGRDIDDLITSMQEVIDMTETVERFESIRNGLDVSDPEYSVITNQIDAANKALTFLKEKNQKLFEGGITKMQGHLNKVNEATTACGTREKKLSLIQNRLMSQKTNFETLESENENVEITDVALQLKGAELTYQAALMSTSKILQTSLMNYI